jgi:hypothetical protein
MSSIRRLRGRLCAPSEQSKARMNINQRLAARSAFQAKIHPPAGSGI